MLSFPSIPNLQFLFLFSAPTQSVDCTETAGSPKDPSPGTNSEVSRGHLSSPFSLHPTYPALRNPQSLIDRISIQSKTEKLITALEPITTAKAVCYTACTLSFHDFFEVLTSCSNFLSLSSLFDSFILFSLTFFKFT